MEFRFFKNKNPIIVELGCGKGEYSVELAKRNPERNYIGIDTKEPDFGGVQKLQMKTICRM